MKRMRGAQSKLERAVQAQINHQAENYDDGAAGFMRDLTHGGCQSGLVGGLIYYTDTVKFYKRHMAEIDALLAEMVRDTGEQPASLFGGGWDDEDPLAREHDNQNLLAWFGFEETARQLAERNDIEL
jgi:hypothetical protein